MKYKFIAFPLFNFCQNKRLMTGISVVAGKILATLKMFTDRLLKGLMGKQAENFAQAEAFTSGLFNN